MCKLVNNNWIKALAVNIIIMVVVLLITDMVYETNDDYAISSRIAAGYPYVNFISYQLATILIPVQRLCGFINVYVLYQIIGSLAAFTCILKLILDVNRNKLVLIATVMIMAIYSFDHYCTIQFTKTSALLMTAGFIILLDSMFNKRKAIYYVIAMLLFYAGALLRFDGMIVALGFAGIYLIFWIVCNRKIIPEQYLEKKRIVLYLVLLVLIAGGWGMQKISCDANVSTPELQKYKAYSELRSEVVDFPIYERYDTNKEKYDKIGISENDLFLVDRWFLDYDGAASSEKLKEIISVDRQFSNHEYSIEKSVIHTLKSTTKSIRNMDFTGIHMVILLLLGLWILLIARPRDFTFVLMMTVVGFCVYAALYYMERPTYRALYIADISATMWILYHFNTVSPEKTSKIGFATGIAIVVIMAGLIVPVWTDAQEKALSDDYRIMPKQMVEYFDSHRNDMFVFNTAENRTTASYNTPIISPAVDKLSNTMGCGSWGTMSPYIMNILAEYNMTNPIKDLLNNEHAYYVGTYCEEALEEYFTKWYGDGKNVVLNKVKEIDGIGIWQVRTQY